MADLRAYQPSFTAGELAPALWARVDLAKYAVGLKKAENLFVYPHGGAANRAGLEFVDEVKDSTKITRLLNFEFSTEQSYIIEFGNLVARFYRDGGLILHAGAPYEIATPYTSADLAGLSWIQEADVMYLTHVNYPPRKLSRLADDNWTLTTPSFAPLQAAPGAPSVAATTGTGTTSYSYKIAAIDDATGEESLPSPAGSVNNDLDTEGNKNTISWTAVTGAERYVVYKLDNGVYGYIGGTVATSFVDQNIVADLSDTPQTGFNPFVGAGNYPRCATFLDQRLFFGGTLNNPNAIYGSQSANYENFGKSTPAKDNDAVTFRIRAKQVQEIRGLLPSRGLLVLTSGGEWVVTGASDQYLTPTSISVSNQGWRGGALVQPIDVGDTIMFAQKRGGVIRDFSFDFTKDGFTANDLTILARHMFENRDIKAWAYAQAPFSIVWVVLDDGSLVSLTYLREHEVVAWTRQVTDGVFEDVTVIGEGKEDVPYFIVRRNIGGVDKRYIERLHTRVFDDVTDAFFVDCGLTYEGVAATQISGLGHLEGKQVVALADGNVVRNLTVSGGSVTLPNAAAKVHVGLPYEATMTTLDLDLGQVQGLGSVQGRFKSISEITLRVEDSRGIWVGPSEDQAKMIEYRQRSTEAWNQAIQLYTGDIQITPQWDWTPGATTVIKQFDPLPMTILANMPDVTLGR